MILHWLLHLLLLPVFLGLAVAGSEPWLRSRAVPTRFAWIGAMLLSLAWATLGALPSRVVEPVQGSIAYLPPVIVQATGAYVRAATPVQQSVDQIAPVLLGCAAVSALFALARLALASLALRAERAAWQRRDIDGWDVLVSGDRGPAVVGIARPAIVLPEWLTTADSATRAIVLRHEREHTAAHDVATLFAGRLLQALVPWSPGIRWVVARLALAIEHDCDQRVLRSGIRRPDYERALLAVADRITAPRLAPSLTESASNLERRITAMRTLDRRHSMLRPVAACSLVLVALYAVVALRGVSSAAAQTPRLRLSVGSRGPTRVQPVAPAAHDESDVVGAVRRTERRVRRADDVAATPDTVYSESQVDRPVRLKLPFTNPAYPDEQRAAGVSGEVLMQFVVDTLGQVEPGSLRVLKSDHENFTAAVRRALETAMFQPATKQGHKVRQLAQEPFVFRVSSPSSK